MIRGSDDREAMELVKAIDTVSNFFKIINYHDSIILAFRTYVNLSVCITALYKIIRNSNKLYLKNRIKLVQRCNKCANQLKEQIDIITSTKEVEQKIKDSDMYLTKRPLRRLLPKQISNEILEYILKRLEFNNKIMYDKDGTIIWTHADKLQERILKKEFTILR